MAFAYYAIIATCGTPICLLIGTFKILEIICITNVMQKNRFKNVRRINWSLFWIILI